MESSAEQRAREEQRPYGGQRIPRKARPEPAADRHAPPTLLAASPQALGIAQLQAVMDNSPRVREQEALGDELNGVVQRMEVAQLYGGTPMDSLRQLLADLLQSGELLGLTDQRQVYDVVYRYYSQGPGPAQTTRIDRNDDPVGVLTGRGFGIPNQWIEQSGGFVKITNPDYNADLQMQGYTRQRMSLHVRADRILDAMLACYDQFRSMPQVSEFKMPSSQRGISNRMDNLVVYFLDNANGDTRQELIAFASILDNQNNNMLAAEHPPMLAPTEVEGVGTAEGWFSVGDSRSQAIAEAYLRWNKQGGVDKFLQTTLKVLQGKGYNPADLSQEPGSSQRCFISTACTQALHLPDNCLELQALRWLRDGYVRRLPTGRRELEEYYDLAPAVVRALSRRPDRDQVYRRVYRRLVVPVVSRVLHGDLADGFRLYKRRVLDLAGDPLLDTACEKQRI